MPVNDLNYYQIDCKRKQEQIVFLQSLRISQDDRFRAGIENLLTPWRVVTDPVSRKQLAVIHDGTTNWTINQLLMQISRDC